MGESAATRKCRWRIVIFSSGLVSIRALTRTLARIQKKPFCYRIQLYSNIFYCKQKYHFRYYLTSSMLSHSHCWMDVVVLLLLLLFRAPLLIILLWLLLLFSCCGCSLSSDIQRQPTYYTSTRTGREIYINCINEIKINLLLSSVLIYLLALHQLVCAHQ